MSEGMRILLNAIAAVTCAVAVVGAVLYLLSKEWDAATTFLLVAILMRTFIRGEH